MHPVVDDHARDGGGDGGVVEVDVDPAQPGEFAAAHAGRGDQQPERVEPVGADVFEEGAGSRLPGGSSPLRMRARRLSASCW